MKRILLVDDEPMILKIMRVAMEDSGFAVEIAHNGEQALAMLDRFQPDAVVTDIDMPRMNGRDLCIRLRERFAAEELPIFVVTAKTAVEHRIWSELIDNLRFLEKPVSIRKLVSRLELALNHQPETEEATQ